MLQGQTKRTEALWFGFQMNVSKFKIFIQMFSRKIPREFEYRRISDFKINYMDYLKMVILQNKYIFRKVINCFSSCQ